MVAMESNAERGKAAKLAVRRETKKEICWKDEWKNEKRKKNREKEEGAVRRRRGREKMKLRKQTGGNLKI